MGPPVQVKADGPKRESALPHSLRKIMDHAPTNVSLSGRTDASARKRPPAGCFGADIPVRPYGVWEWPMANGAGSVVGVSIVGGRMGSPLEVHVEVNLKQPLAQGKQCCHHPLHHEIRTVSNP